MWPFDYFRKRRAEKVIASLRLQSEVARLQVNAFEPIVPRYDAPLIEADEPIIDYVARRKAIDAAAAQDALRRAERYQMLAEAETGARRAVSKRQCGND
jgi:hypothetical protein